MIPLKNSLFIGKVLLTLNSIDSTNSYALQLLSKTKPIDGTVILAHEQSSGKGQIGAKWISEAGKNLTISIILYPKFIEPSEQFLLNQAISLGIRDFASRELSCDIKIKWPNDIYYGNDKLGGVLIENGISGRKISYSVIGIGLNINQIEFPEELPNPTSFKLIRNKEYDLAQSLAKLLSFIEKYYLALRAGKAGFIQNEYIANLFLKDTVHLFRVLGKPVYGEIIGTAPSGLLMLQVDGAVKSYNLKQISY